MKFYPKDSAIGFNVSDKKDIIACMGELGSSIQSIDVLENGSVIGYLGGQGVTIGHLKDE
jgi:hypothetical protein